MTACGGCKAAALPFETAVDEPMQDPGHSAFSFSGEF